MTIKRKLIVLGIIALIIVSPLVIYTYTNYKKEIMLNYYGLSGTSQWQIPGYPNIHNKWLCENKDGYWTEWYDENYCFAENPIGYMKSGY